MDYTFLQEYWWLLISILGAFLVFMLFVQGGQSMLLQEMPDEQREKMIDTIAHRWELTFTTLVVFGGAFFASFPLFYSTSFGGAYWLWMLILFGFVVQAVSYKYRKAEGNILGRKTYDVFLFLNGLLAPVLLGGAVSTFFFGNDFTITKTNLTDASSPIISQWGHLHGLEALADWRVVAFGLMVLFLVRVLANLWFINQINDEQTILWNKKQLRINGAVFVVLYLIEMGVILTSSGYEAIGEHEFLMVKYKYFHNLFGHFTCILMFLLGTASVIYGICVTLIRKTRSGIWFGGIGTVLVVLVLFWLAGYYNTAYYPSYSDMASSLTIYNSSSSEFTLRTMSYVSIAIPFVIAYISWVWYKLSKPQDKNVSIEMEE